MTTKTDFDQYLKRFDKKAKKYIPSKKNWVPPHHAIYGPKDLLRTPREKAKKLKFKAIKYQFKRHYEKNSFYHGFCKERNISPADIKTHDDLEKIPLIPGDFYKDYPTGKDFALWLGNLFTGEIPEVTISGKNPSFDEVIEAFNDAGLEVCYSSGTSGRHTFIPRDKRTFNISQYVAGKLVTNLAYPVFDFDMYGYLLMPNPFKAYVYAGRAIEVFYEIVGEVEAAIDRKVTTETVRTSMAQTGGLKSKITKFFAKRMYKKIVKDIINWLEKHERNNDKIALVGAPFILYLVMNKMEEQGKTFDFENRGAVVTGGGWKIHEDQRMPVSDFRKKVNSMLGIKEKHCLDTYAMVEGNGWMVQCPEGHYLHVPHTYYHPMVLDEEFKPKGFGEYGRFAFLDGSTFSYPGFIISGDKVRLLEHCPVCDRPGPVLEPEVKRASGQEARGCAEEVRRMISSDISE